MDDRCWMLRRRAFRSLFLGVALACAQLPELVHPLRRAIGRAGTIDRDQDRRALEDLPPHQGPVRVYDPAFTARRHDAPDASDFRRFRFAEGGAIVPMAVP